VAKPLEFDDFSEPEKTERSEEDQGESSGSGVPAETVKPPRKVPPKADEFEWVWKVCPGCDSESPSPNRFNSPAGARDIEAYIFSVNYCMWQ